MCAKIDVPITANKLLCNVGAGITCPPLARSCLAVAGGSLSLRRVADSFRTSEIGNRNSEAGGSPPVKHADTLPMGGDKPLPYNVKPPLGGS